MTVHRSILRLHADQPLPVWNRGSGTADRAPVPPLTMTRGPATQKFQRAKPSAAEHARRVAWGKRWGRLVADSVKRSMRGQG